MNINIIPQDIVCYHVGGCGGYGPIEAILNSPFRNSVLLVVFEARESSDNLQTIEEYNDKGIRTMLLNSCVSDKIGEETFYINKHVASSSLLRPSEKSRGEHIPQKEALTWGDNTELDRAITVKTTTIDHLVQSKVLPPPDVLSVDAQGAEYRILIGGEQAIKTSVLGVVTEVEFLEVYEGQRLFHDQFHFLHSLGFRLSDILNQQFWHPAPIAGEGFLTVGEALFLREPEAWEGLNNSDDMDRLRGLYKLAAISYCFKRYSNVYRVVEHIVKCYGNSVGKVIEENRNYGILMDMHSLIGQNLDRYLLDKSYLKKRLQELDKLREIAQVGGPQAGKTGEVLKCWVKRICPPILLDIVRAHRR